MIARTILSVVTIAATVNAFTVQQSGIVSRTSRLSMIPDKEFEEKLKTEMKDASRATILECDDTECAQVQCVQDNRGNWTCEGGLEGEDRKTTKTVLMMSEDDD
eukprot:CAMPEP_0171354370 /NCGR_PEP_ID=MMETSP0878-20121228/44671_1 /TAXON_ID=67004 /ORGANISM="Thalassiosira weissflogii, Strain CCMP1336" /LENGTH=103 /DNA_ID=CAMNT_0011860343 /DNA_START=182 /DNA_END=493 /DNA_ORIENTATION=-